LKLGTACWLNKRRNAKTRREAMPPSGPNARQVIAGLGRSSVRTRRPSAFHAPPEKGAPLPFPISKVHASTRRPVPARRVYAVCPDWGRGVVIYVARNVDSLTVGRPRFHELAPVFQRVAAPVNWARLKHRPGISSHGGPPRTSLVLAAVRMANSSTRAAMRSCSRKLTVKPVSSE
jgi:hypothetical protein